MLDWFAPILVVQMGRLDGGGSVFVLGTIFACNQKVIYEFRGYFLLIRKPALEQFFQEHKIKPKFCRRTMKLFSVI